MYVKQSFPENSKMTLLTWLMVLVVLAACFMLLIRPLFYLLGINLMETFHFSFSVTDLDLDRDPDVWVNRRRNEQEYVAFAGASVEINQGGLQGGQTGQAGRFIASNHDIRWEPNPKCAFGRFER